VQWQQWCPCYLSHTVCCMLHAETARCFGGKKLPNNERTSHFRHGLWGLDHTRLKYICRDTEKVPTPRQVCRFRLH